jgi:hypothetical protein
MPDVWPEHRQISTSAARAGRGQGQVTVALGMLRLNAIVYRFIFLDRPWRIDRRSVVLR